MGVLLARLALAGFDPPALAAALPEAVAEGARATERWGAVE
jgi:fructokinase